MFYAKGRSLATAEDLLTGNGYGWPLIVVGEREMDWVRRTCTQEGITFKVIERELLKNTELPVTRYSLEFSNERDRNSVSSRLRQMLPDRRGE